MPNYKIKSEVTVTYIHDVYADSIEEAIASVEDGDDHSDSYEVDSSPPVATEYIIEDQGDWNDVTDAVRGAEDRFAHSPNNCPSNHWNRGDDICEDCGLNLND